MIDNLFDVLYVAKTGKIKPDASLTDNLFGMKLGGGDVITTATGNPVSIVTNNAQNAISTILSYSPKQSGTGDPSPQNIRPIEGWTEANLTGAGKNLFDLSTLATTGITYADGVLTGTAGAFYTAYSSVIPYDFSFLKNSRVSIACEAKVQKASGTGNGLKIIITYTDGTRSEFIWKNNNDSYVRKYFASAEGKSVSDIYITYGSNASNVWLIRSFQIEVGTVPTDYEPFITPTTITESLGGTYYGFTVDVERGVLRVTHDLVTYTSGWKRASNGVFYMDDNTMPYGSVAKKASLYECINNVVNSTTEALAYPKKICQQYLNNFTRWLVYDPDITTESDFNDMIFANPLQIAYILATPIELPLTPQTVALFAGNNTLWTDGDEVSITYKARG